VKAYIKLFS